MSTNFDFELEILLMVYVEMFLCISNFMEGIHILIILRIMLIAKSIEYKVIDDRKMILMPWEVIWFHQKNPSIKNEV